MIIDPDVQPEVGRGDLTYRMAITGGELGGTTRVQITPNHSFGDVVGARLVLLYQLLLFYIVYCLKVWYRFIPIPYRFNLKASIQCLFQCGIM